MPDVDKLVMDGDRIYVTDEVRKKLEEHVKNSKLKPVRYMHHIVFSLHTLRYIHLLICIFYYVSGRVASASASNEASQGICSGNISSLSSLSLFM